MSKARSLSALAASVCTLVAACWLVTNTFPLAAAPQVMSDAPGVTVELGAATLRHRAPVDYPESARSKGIQGVVSLELAFDATGAVADARVISGPEELRKPALQSVLQWHFARESAGTKRVVTISFQLPVTPAPAAAPRVPVPDPTPVAAASARRTVKSIRVLGLSDQARDELLASLPLKLGAPAGPEDIRAVAAAVRQFDEHLSTSSINVGTEEVAITIIAPTPNAASTVSSSIGVVSNAIKVGGNLQSTKLIRQPRPVYPPDAKAARIQGAVKLLALIAKDGTMKQLEVISGHPLLVPAAMESVRQWVYETTLLNGEPVEVQTQIDVNFTLSQ